MAKARILIVEDDPDIGELVSYSLRKEGLQVRLATSGEDALKSARAEIPDLALVDLMLPGMDGFDLIRALKADQKTRGILVLVVTAKGEDSDMVAGLELGAEDYIVKPFSPRVLVARVKARLRSLNRMEAGLDPAAAGVLRLGPFTLDPAAHELSVEGRLVELSATEFSLLGLLMGNPGIVYPRSKIIDSIKGSDYPVTERSVDVQVLGLRKKLGTAGAWIETVRGVGYRAKRQ